MYVPRNDAHVRAVTKGALAASAPASASTRSGASRATKEQEPIEAGEVAAGSDAVELRRTENEN